MKTSIRNRINWQRELLHTNICSTIVNGNNVINPIYNHQDMYMSLVRQVHFIRLVTIRHLSETAIVPNPANNLHYGK